MTTRYNPNRTSLVTRSLIRLWTYPDLNDIRVYYDWDTAPIEVVRQRIADAQLGVHTTIFGEAFERAVGKAMYLFFANRNRRAGVDLYSRLLNISYIENFTLVAGARDAIELCISQILGSAATNSQVIEEVRRAMEWLLPHWTGSVTISICATAAADLYIYPGGVITTLAHMSLGD